VDARAGNRCDVDHRAAGTLQLPQQAARQKDRREQVDLEHVLPVLELGIDGAEAGAGLPLRRNAGIVDQCVQPSTLRCQARLHFGDGAQGVASIGQIDLDVILRPHLPGAVLGEGVARAGGPRQPARAKRFTVAWPMPQAPVRIGSVPRRWGRLSPQAISAAGAGEARDNAGSGTRAQ
jgi:hypothetical protein